MKFQSVSTNAIILNPQNQILFVRRSLEDDFLPGFWELPGGGIEYGETPQVGLIREIKEECCLDIDVKNPVSVNTYFMGENQRVEITFVCHLTDENQEVKLSPEHSEFKWLTLEESKQLKNLDDYIVNILKDYQMNLSNI